MVSFPQVSPAKPCIHLSHPHTCYTLHQSHSSWFYHQNNTGWGVQITKLLIMLLSLLPVPSSVLGPNILPASYSQKSSAYVPPSMWATKFHTHTKQQAKLYLKIKYCKWKITHANRCIREMFYHISERLRYHPAYSMWVGGREESISAEPYDQFSQNLVWTSHHWMLSHHIFNLDSQ